MYKTDIIIDFLTKTSISFSSTFMENTVGLLHSRLFRDSGEKERKSVLFVLSGTWFTACLGVRWVDAYT